MTTKPTWRTVAMPLCSLCGKPLSRTGDTYRWGPNVFSHWNSRCPRDLGQATHDRLLPDCPDEGCAGLFAHKAHLYAGDTLARDLAAKTDPQPTNQPTT